MENLETHSADCESGRTVLMKKSLPGTRVVINADFALYDGEIKEVVEGGAEAALNKNGEEYEAFLLWENYSMDWWFVGEEIIAPKGPKIRTEAVPKGYLKMHRLEKRLETLHRLGLKLELSGYGWEASVRFKRGLVMIVEPCYSMREAIELILKRVAEYKDDPLRFEACPLYNKAGTRLTSTKSLRYRSWKP